MKTMPLDYIVTTKNDNYSNDKRCWCWWWCWWLLCQLHVSNQLNNNY